MFGAPRKKKRVNWWLGVGVSLLITLLASYFGRVAVLHELELKTYDQRMQLRGPVAVDSSDIVLVTIDDEDFTSLDRRWPFPRQYYGRVLDNLFAAGARMVVIDIQFFESSDDSTEDLTLAEATAARQDSVVHSAKISFQTRKQVAETMSRVMLPTRRLRVAAEHVGVVNEIHDRDGFTRQYPFSFVLDSLNYLPLSMKAYQLLQPDPDTVGLRRDDPAAVRFADLRIPKMTANSFLIHYYGPAGTFPVHHLSSVLDDPEFDLANGDTDYMQWFTMPEEQFQTLIGVLPEESAQAFRQLREDNPFSGKIVFIGAAAAALQDTKKTPFFTWSPPGQIASSNEAMPGVEVHANALQTLIDRSWYHNAPLWAELLLTFGLVLLVFAVNNALGLALAAPVTIVLAFLYSGGAYYAFSQHHVWLAMVIPLTAMLAMFVFTSVYRFVLEQRDKAAIRGMFSQYVPKKVVDQIIDHPELLKLGGEKRRMTALFTDVVGFTTVSEKLSPEELVGLLNDYLSEMSRIILENEGIIDKYEGDLIMAEWGAPVYREDHAELACRAALQMQARLAELRERFRAEGRPELESRVGINTGAMIVGNMGCLEVFDYTVMGDAVNLASRLEGANKSYGTTIMIGPETFKDVKDQFVTRVLDDLRVKGKDEPVRVYELLAESPSDLTPGKRTALAAYRRGWAAYRDRDFDTARDHFEQALFADPSDGPSRTYLARCDRYLATPPPEQWDGVFELTEK